MLVVAAVGAVLLVLGFGARPPLTSAAPISDLGDGIVAALPANAAATNQYVTINSVSCPSAGNCSAVGSYTASDHTGGLLLTETDGKWAVGIEAVPPVFSGRVVLNSVSCASAGNCTAVGTYDSGGLGLLVSETNGTWAAGVEAVLPSNARSSYQYVDLVSVSCPSAGNCSAVGTYSENSPSYRGLAVERDGGFLGSRG